MTKCKCGADAPTSTKRCLPCNKTYVREYRKRHKLELAVADAVAARAEPLPVLVGDAFASTPLRLWHVPKPRPDMSKAERWLVVERARRAVEHNRTVEITRKLAAEIGFDVWQGNDPKGEP